MKFTALKLEVALVGAAVAAALGCGAANAGPELGSEEGDAAELASFEPEVASAEELGELGQPLVNCSNVDGTNSVMAALAVSVAKELRRWQPTVDLMVFNTSGFSEASPGAQQAIKLTPTGKARCADGRCYNTQALLDMQYEQANNQVKLPGNITLSPAALRSRLVAKLREQATCEAQPANGGNNCPVEQHQLTFVRSEPGGCDTNFFFKATQPNGAPLRFPAQLKNKLLWVDRVNPYVAFQSVGDVVSIDPVFGLNDFGSTRTATCSAACTRITSEAITGQCCSCNGVTRKFARSLWSPVTYLCR